MKDFMFAWFKKIMSNFASAKMSLFFLPFIGSCIFLYMMFDIYNTVHALPKISPELVSVVKIVSDAFMHWLTFTVSLGGMVIACREYFKVQSIKSDSDKAKIIKEYNELTSEDKE